MSEDALVQRAIADRTHGHEAAFQKDIDSIFHRDTDLSDPANRGPGHVRAQLMRDGEALHKGGIDNAMLRKLGFPVDDDRKPRPDDALKDRTKLDNSPLDSSQLDGPP